MLNILDELAKRTSFYLTVDYEDSVYDQFAGSNENAVLIMPERWFQTAFDRNPHKISGYHIAGLFDLGVVYSPNISVRFSLYLFTKKTPDTVKTGVLLETIQREERIKHDGLPGVYYPALPSSYPDTVYFYFEEIENWVNNEKKPHDSFYATYNEIVYSDFHINEPYALRYTSSSAKIREKLSSETIVPLSVLADVIEPSINELISGNVTYLNSREEFSYPLKKEYFCKPVGGVPDFRLKRRRYPIVFFCR